MEFELGVGTSPTEQLGTVTPGRQPRRPGPAKGATVLNYSSLNQLERRLLEIADATTFPSERDYAHAYARGVLDYFAGHPGNSPSTWETRGDLPSEFEDVYNAGFSDAFSVDIGAEELQASHPRISQKTYRAVIRAVQRRSP